MPTSAAQTAATADDKPTSRGAPQGSPDGAGEITVRGVSKVFPNGTAALTPTDLRIGAGQFVSIVGPSGCGKSTLLRIIAGLVPASTGECSMPSGSRRAFVFQDATLLPWRTVRKNAQLLLELEGFDKHERDARIAEALKLVSLDGFEKAYPRALSGGMKMRLSLARALALRPKVFLMDEPFSALDEITREVLQDELLRIWALENFTALFVTHNLYEAVYLSSRVIVMSARPGRVVADIEVSLPYPRTPELRQTPEFNEISAKVSAALRGGAVS
ncbi:MAG: ABC transporter ATP-binding protein [Thermoleophilaceae bacterium]|nr:ABC transporter ATP-binding protein [Thermoleophilaceae bacterium]